MYVIVGRLGLMKNSDLKQELGNTYKAQHILSPLATFVEIGIIT